MGITGELVRSVFSKSNGHQASNGGHSGKRKWSSSVRSYLCGDEHGSILAADDEDGSASVGDSTVTEAEFASFRSNVATDKSTGTREFSAISAAEEDTASEATVNQPLLPERPNSDGGNREEKQNSTFKLFQQEDAALTIQSAFRNFMERRADVAKTFGDVEESAASPSRESIGTSVEVQTANSSHIFSIKEESDCTRHPIRRRSGAQVLKIQEDWDDSTVSSVISKMRMQHKLEAATRRERALAYAFSQQLRICSKKQSAPNGDEANMGWSWLERWMAARQPEMNEDGNKTSMKKRFLDGVATEEESCGSNEVSSTVEVCNIPFSVPKNLPKPSNKGRSQAKRSFSRQNSTSSHLSPKESKDEKEKRKRQKQPGIKRDVKSGSVDGAVEHETEY